MLLALLSFLVYHFFLRRRLALASTILHIASQAISLHITLVFYWAMLILAQLSFSLLWLMAVIGAATNEGTESQHKGCSTFSYSGTYVLGPAMTLSCPESGATCEACVCDNNTRIASATNPCFEPKLLPSQFFGLLLVYLWVSNTLSGVVHCGVSKATASWWGRAEGAPEALIALGFRKALTTSFGSIALGSLLVSIIQLARFAVGFFSRALQQQGAASSTSNSHRRCSVVRAFALSCLGAALSTLDRASTYFNKVSDRPAEKKSEPDFVSDTSPSLPPLSLNFLRVLTSTRLSMWPFSTLRLQTLQRPWRACLRTEDGRPSSTMISLKSCCCLRTLAWVSPSCSWHCSTPTSWVSTSQTLRSSSQPAFLWVMRLDQRQREP